ncbi:hypothetical protein HELRODRAFT_162162 [Helobdella robusta]|uniref:TRAF-type domain-containing protein n=1 Tax=Helobdella robusta TaxID=6412 RepID=T1ESA8_HELRO|nr:hypothetical protein HELRODRAFT_162162 [Helobdella robusta]ESN98709.1 hypothetical protein HELRODRAFT_162162 [Helobdella robusta]
MSSLQSNFNSLQPINSSIQFVSPNPSYTCESCKGYLVDPYQLICGHRICSNCKVNFQSKVFDCPSGDETCEKISYDKVASVGVVHNKLLKNMLTSLFITFSSFMFNNTYRKFINEVNCTRINRVTNVDKLDLWNFGVMLRKCKMAGFFVGYIHKLRELKDYEVYCTNKSLGCPATCKLHHLKKHLDEECLYVKVNCPHDCYLTDVFRYELNDHLEKCPMKPVRCQFQEIGCDYMNYMKAIVPIIIMKK